MADLSSSDFLNRVKTNINDYVIPMIQWSAENPRPPVQEQVLLPKQRGRETKTLSVMDTSALAPVSEFQFDPTPALTGDASVSRVVSRIVAEAVRCSAIRRVQTGRKYTGTGKWNDSSGYDKLEYRHTAIGIAALKSSWRWPLPSANTAAAAAAGLAVGQDLDRQKLDNYINQLRTELYNNIYNSPLVDLRVCHNSCHDNCHSSRTRR